MAHTLKGVAAQIGAPAIEQAARGLEQSLQAQAPAGQIQPHVHAVQALLEPLVHALRARLERMPLPPGKQAPVDQAQWQSVKMQLTDMLAGGEGAAVHFCQTHEALIRSAMGQRFEALGRAVNDFDFDTALALLAAENSSVTDDSP